MPLPTSHLLLPQGSQKSEVHTPSSTCQSSSTAPLHSVPSILSRGSRFSISRAL